jgi:hypothetical protein
LTIKPHITSYFHCFICIFIQTITTLYGQEIKVTPLKLGSVEENVFASYYFEGNLYFCSDKMIKSKQKYIDEGNNNNYLNIYKVRTQLGSNPSQKPIKLSDSISSKLNEGPLIFNSARTSVYFSSNIFNNREDSTLRLGLFTASYNGYDFGTRSAISELKFEKHNVAHPALFQNDNVLIFVSDNDSSKGKSDLFYSYNENGKWSSPINMSEVNTEFTETFPTVFDNKLYFASDRPGGSGGLDIYVTVFMDGKWMSPVRLPSPINSEYDDFLFIPVDGKRGYFSSNRLNEVDKVFQYQYNFPSIENYITQNFDTCFTFKDENIENREELIYTWTFSDGAVYEGNEVNHCFSKMGKHTVSCSILEVQADSIHKNVDEIELTISYELPLIKYSNTDNLIILDCYQNYSTTKYANWYWKINGINYYEPNPKIQKSSQMDVKLILWNNDEDAIGIKKLFLLN